MEKHSKPRSRPTRETFYVRVDVGNGAVAFVNATEHIGRTMPFTKPRATLAMQVTDTAVSFSLLHLTKNNAATVSSKPITMPKGPLARLERRAEQQYADLPADELVVELSTRQPGPRPAPAAAPTPDPAAALTDLFTEPSAADQGPPEPAPTPDPAAALTDLFTEPSDSTSASDAPPGGGDDGSEPARRKPQRPATIESWRYKLRRDDNDVVTLEAADDDHTFELPRGAIHVSVYLRSPRVNRVMAVSFIGHVGRPGNVETMGRVASMVLNSMSHLPEFRVLAGIETVVVPAAPNRPTPARKSSFSRPAAFTTQVYLFDDALNPVASGLVGVEFDLENANPTSGKLLSRVTPEETLAEAFESYRGVFDLALAGALKATMSDEDVAEITYDIILGGVSEGTIDRLIEVGEQLQSVDLSPTQFRPHA
jgi:hypothetical protein